jgi:hypothetical protein
MSIEAGIYSVLSSSTSLSALVGTRIFPNTVPQNTSFPHVSFTIDDTENYHGLTLHETLARASVSVECYTSNSYQESLTIGKVVRNILNTNSTTWGTMSVQNAHVSGESDLGGTPPADGSDDYIYIRSLDCDVFFYST